MVGETGWQLSHGERSRLFLARALLQGADLTILDPIGEVDLSHPFGDLLTGHAGLHVQLKTLVESLYERKLIQVLYTTSTFALARC